MGPRDGLQNEKNLVSFQDKMEFVRGLVRAGVRELELGAFVRPDRVPQMADTERLFAAIQQGKLDLGRAARLEPRAQPTWFGAGARGGRREHRRFHRGDRVVHEKHIGMTIRESLTEFGHVIRQAKRVGARAFRSAAMSQPRSDVLSRAKSRRKRR